MGGRILYLQEKEIQRKRYKRRKSEAGKKMEIDVVKGYTHRERDRGREGEIGERERWGGEREREGGEREKRG